MRGKSCGSNGLPSYSFAASSDGLRAAVREGTPPERFQAVSHGPAPASATTVHSISVPAS